MEKVTQFRSDAGRTFETEHEAHKDDLHHWLREAAGNDPIARQIASAIEADLQRFASIIKGVADSAPEIEPELPMQDAARRSAEQIARTIRDFTRGPITRFGTTSLAHQIGSVERGDLVQR